MQTLLEEQEHDKISLVVSHSMMKRAEMKGTEASICVSGRSHSSIELRKEQKEGIVKYHRAGA